MSQIDEMLEESTKKVKLIQIIEVLIKDSQLVERVWQVVVEGKELCLPGGAEKKKCEDATYAVREIAEMLNMKRSSVYKFIKETYDSGKPFCVRRIGGQYRIPKDVFDRWLRGGD